MAFFVLEEIHPEKPCGLHLYIALMLVIMMLLVARVAQNVQNSAGRRFQLCFVHFSFHGTH
jgi:hypothetical protein